MAALKSKQNQDTLNAIDGVHKTPCRLTKMNTYDPGESTVDPVNLNKIGNTHQFTIKKALTSRSCDFNQQMVQGNFVFNYKPSSENNSLTRHSIDFINSQSLSLDPSKKIFTSSVLSPKVTLPKQENEISKNHLQEKTEEDSTNEHIQDHPSSGGSVSPQEQYPIKKFNFQNPIETIENKDDDFGMVSENQEDFQNNEADEGFFHVDENLFGMNNEQSKSSENDLGQVVFYKKSQFSRKDIQLIKPERILTKNENQLDSSDSKDDNSSENDEESEGERQNGVQDSLPNPVQVRIKNKQKKFSTIVSEEEGSNASPKLANEKISAELTPAQRRKSQLSQIDTQRFKEALEKSKSNSKQQAQNTPKTPLTPGDKLKILGTVARTLSRLQVNQVNRIESSDQLDKEMLSVRQNSSFFQDNLNSGQKHHNEMDVALNQLRMVEMLTDLAERGHPQDQQSMVAILRKDPKQYLRSTDDPQHILNRLNSKNQNCPYVACKNGNLNIVEFLVHNEANFGIKSKVGGKFEEYPLQVAVRWNHFEVVKFLLSKKITSISQDQIRLAYKEAKTNELKQLFSKFIPKKPFFICC